MTTPYLKDTTRSDNYSPVANRHIESGDYVRFTGAYDSQGTAIYDGDYLVCPSEGWGYKKEVYFNPTEFRWDCGVGDRLEFILRVFKCIIVQPPQPDPDTEIDTLTTRIVTLEAELKELRGGDTAVKPKYQVFHQGETFKNEPLFIIGCNKGIYQWFIDKWAHIDYNGSLSSTEIIAQRAALDAEYKRVTGRSGE